MQIILFNLLVDWVVCCLVGWVIGCLIGLVVCCLVCCAVPWLGVCGINYGCLLGWLVGLSVTCFHVWIAGWLAICKWKLYNKDSLITNYRYISETSSSVSLTTHWLAHVMFVHAMYESRILAAYTA